MDQTPGGEKQNAAKGGSEGGAVGEDATPGTGEEIAASDPAQDLANRIAALVETTSSVIFNYTAQVC
jgi:hypothetical protein